MRLIKLGDSNYTTYIQSKSEKTGEREIKISIVSYRENIKIDCSIPEIDLILKILRERSYSLKSFGRTNYDAWHVL